MRKCNTPRAVRMLLPQEVPPGEGGYARAYVAMQRLEELDSAAPVDDDPKHALTALAGSNFERAYCALRPTRSPMAGAGAGHDGGAGAYGARVRPALAAALGQPAVHGGDHLQQHQPFREPR